MKKQNTPLQIALRRATAGNPPPPQLARPGLTANRETLPTMPTPELGPTVAGFLADCHLAVKAREGNRLTLAVMGESLFDKLTSRPDPANRSQWPDVAHAIAAAAIRERRYGDGWPMGSAADWREWAGKFGELPQCNKILQKCNIAP